MDVLFSRLCCPEDVVAWIRAVLNGHRRVVATAYRVDDDDAGRAGGPAAGAGRRFLTCVTKIVTTSQFS